MNSSKFSRSSGTGKFSFIVSGKFISEMSNVENEPGLVKVDDRCTSWMLSPTFLHSYLTGIYFGLFLFCVGRCLLLLLFHAPEFDHLGFEWEGEGRKCGVVWKDKLGIAVAINYLQDQRPSHMTLILWFDWRMRLVFITDVTLSDLTRRCKNGAPCFVHPFAKKTHHVWCHNDANIWKRRSLAANDTTYSTYVQHWDNA
jgi:hypothetical protein